MNPVKPVLRYVPARVIPPRQVIFAEHQPEYIPLPVIEHGNCVTSRWKLTWRERLHMLFFGFFFITQMNFGETLQPIRPDTEQPEPWR